MNEKGERVDKPEDVFADGPAETQDSDSEAGASGGRAVVDGGDGDGGNSGAVRGAGGDVWRIGGGVVLGLAVGGYVLA